MEKGKRNVILVGVLLAALWGVYEWLGWHRIYDPLIWLDSYQELREKCIQSGFGVPEESLLPTENSWYSIVMGGRYDWDEAREYALSSEGDMDGRGYLYCVVSCKRGKENKVIEYLPVKICGEEVYSGISLLWKKGQILESFYGVDGYVKVYCHTAEFSIQDQNYVVRTYSKIDGLTKDGETMVNTVCKNIAMSIVDSANTGKEE